MVKIDIARYSLAGRLAVVSAVLLFPEIGGSILLSFIAPGMDIYLAPIQLVNLLIGIYVLYTFRVLLNAQFAFHGTDLVITTLILVKALFFISGQVEIIGAVIRWEYPHSSGLQIATVVLLVLYGLLLVLFGIGLLRMRDNMFGLLRPFAYATVVGGVSLTTVLLAPVGLLVAAVALVIQGMVFLRTEREAEIL